MPDASRSLPSPLSPRPVTHPPYPPPERGGPPARPKVAARDPPLGAGETRLNRPGAARSPAFCIATFSFSNCSAIFCIEEIDGESASSTARCAAFKPTTIEQFA